LAITTLTAVDNFINAAGGTLPANVWPTGPAGVRFSDAECAELHRLLGLFYNAPGWPYRVRRDGFVRVEWHLFRGWLVGHPPDSELHAAWAAINELLYGKLLAAGILGLFYVACWRVVFNQGNTDPDHQDVEADFDLYGAGGRRCFLSCNAKGQRRPFHFKRRGKLLYETDSNFLSMDGAAAGSGGRKFSPYTHGRHDADKGQLGASIQFDLVPKASQGGKASVPGRGTRRDQTVTRYYDTGQRLNDHRGVDRAGGPPDAVELLRRRHAEAHPMRLDSSGAGPSDLRHCYMCETRGSGQWFYWPPKRVADPQPPHHRVCATCRASLHNGSLDKEEHRASRCGLAYQCPDGACGPNGC
jgi:hypothetical protein